MIQVSSMKQIIYPLVLLGLSINILADASLVNLQDLAIEKLTHKELHQHLIDSQVANYNVPLKSLKSRNNVKSLNGLYDFCFDKSHNGFKNQWHSGELRLACNQAGDFYRMPVPSAFNEILSNTTALNYMGLFWYQTHVGLQSGQDIQKYMLQFESINYLAIIYGQLEPYNKPAIVLGSHVGGHLPITLKLDKLISGNEVLKSGLRLRLTIAVDNTLSSETIPSGRMVDLSDVVGYPLKQFQPDFDFFHFAGIMGDVNLIGLPENHIESVISNFKYSSTGRKSIEALIFRVCLDHPKSSNLMLDYKLENVSHQVVHQQTIKLGLDHISPNCIQIITAFTEDLHHDSINSLRATFILQRSSTSSDIDTYETMIRLPLNIDLPNTDKLSLHGFGMHHEQMFSGRSMGLAAIMKDIYLLKQVGANVIRTSHYPYSSDYLDACDEQGIMVIAECPAVGLKSFSDTKLKLHKQMLREMMWRDHHHSSIIMWSVANEPESQHEEARPYFDSLLAYARQELVQFTVAAHRPLTAAIAQSHEADKVGQFLDVIMINRYYGWYDYTGALETIRPAMIASLRGWSEKHPDKALMISEFGADTLPGQHKTTRGIYTEEYQRDLIGEHEKVFAELFNSTSFKFIGSMIWNFADFTTHESLLRVGGINRKGIFTREREPKLAVTVVKTAYQERNLLNKIR